MKSAIAEAKPLLDSSASGNGMTSDELERAADDVHEAMESVVSAGLGKSHPLVKKATELEKTLRDDGSKIKVSARGSCGVKQYLNDGVSGVASVCVAIPGIRTQYGRSR